MPISALPSPYGIGTLGKAAYDFVDFLKDSSQTYWQVLPIGPTGYGDSPYSAFSAFAGNHYFIDLDMLVEEGLLKLEDLETLEYNDDFVDYSKIFKTRLNVLKIAFSNFNPNLLKFRNFCNENDFWLYDYAFYMALKSHHNEQGWLSFNKGLRLRKEKELSKYKNILTSQIDFHLFLQFIFFEQWHNLKKYANKNSVQLIGDLPIYVAQDSADLFFNPSLFQLNRSLKPKFVAGTPPDDFAKDGQLWGNPLYNWKKHKKTNYNWWRRRIIIHSKLFDVIRIDHFRGFASYYSVKASAKTAVGGKWKKGPGLDFFVKLSNEFETIGVVAEDLGLITPDVDLLIEQTKFASMKVLQFAFSDLNMNNRYLPHNYNKNCVVYTGTHDNTTTKDYFDKQPIKVQNFILEYLKTNDKNIVQSFIKLAYESVASVAIIPIGDVLNLDICGRINTPATTQNNWVFRINASDLNEELAQSLKNLIISSKR